MNIEQIEVIIGPDGKVHLQASGFSGNACMEATEELESLLGNQVVSRERTGSFVEKASGKTAEKVKIRG